MRRLINSVHLAAWISAAAASQACADGDPVKGERVFLKCKACHEIATDKNKVGPTLQGVLGRKAGSVGGFKYSEAMLNSQVVWDTETIADYVEKPKEFIAGNKMVFAGLKKADEIEDLIAFIAANCCS